MTWTAVLLFCASWVAYLNRVSPCSNAAQTNGIADYLKYRRREDMSCCFENCFCSVKVPTWTLSKYRPTLLVYFLTASISPQNCIWVCLKIGYIPNEIAIFFGDNDQQNHWVFRGTQHFQTNPYLQNVLLPISLGPCPPDPRCQSLLPEWITFAASAPCVSVQVQHLPIPAPWLWNWGRAYVHQWPPWNISQWQSNRRHVPNVKTVKTPKKKERLLWLLADRQKKYPSVGPRCVSSPISALPCPGQKGHIPEKEIMRWTRSSMMQPTLESLLVSISCRCIWHVKTQKKAMDRRNRSHPFLAFRISASKIATWTEGPWKKRLFLGSEKKFYITVAIPSVSCLKMSEIQR